MLSKLKPSGASEATPRRAPHDALVPPAAPLTLTVVLPVYNGAGWISRSLRAVDLAAQAALDASVFASAEIIVVDDGSTDGTLAEIEALATTVPCRVLSQPNRGRFLARRAGLDAAQGNMVLFIDTRVFLDPGALTFVGADLATADGCVWTADVRAETAGNPIARFWRAIEHVAWRRYHGNPRRTRFGIAEFDWYPKGTTAFLCPTALLRAAYDDFEPTVDDAGIINDDTALLRFVAERSPINIAPQYGCVYHARTSLKAFLKHANHRGSVLIDGYMVPGARFNRAIRVVLAASPIGLLIMLRKPKLALVGAVAGSAAAGAAARIGGAESRDAAVLGTLSVPFGVAYLAGMWRGALSRLRLQRRSGRA